MEESEPSDDDADTSYVEEDETEDKMEESEPSDDEAGTSYGEISSNLYRASVRDMKKNNFQICMLSQNLLYNVQGT